MKHTSHAWTPQPVTARYNPIEAPDQCLDPKPATKRLLDGTAGVFRPILRAFITWKLRKEATRHMKSFFAISEAMGLSPYSSKHSPEQQQRLKRVQDIAAQLRQLNFSHLEAQP